MEYLLTTTNLAKSYGSSRALLGCSLHVPQGAVYALIGENGAGKTTLLKLLSGQEKPLTGMCMLLGSQSRFHKGKSGEIRFVAAESRFSGHQTCEKVLFGRHGASGENEQRLLGEMGLISSAKMCTASLSPYGRLRLAVAAAILPRPRLLLLDEPFRGLDAAACADFRRLLGKIREEYGTAVLISAASEGILGDLPDTYGFLHGGRLLGEFDAALVQTSVLLRVSSARRAGEILEGRHRFVVQSDQKLRVFGKGDLEGVLTSLTQAGIRVLQPQTAAEIRPSAPAFPRKGAVQWAAC